MLKKAKNLGKYEIFLKAVYMIYFYSKRFRFAPSFNYILNRISTRYLLFFRLHGHSVLHTGPIASGRPVALDDQLRQEYAARNGILAFDSDLDAVVESIYGNRKDQYTLIRGMADYKDGTRRKEWQQYAALMAAAVLKTVIQEMA